MKLYQIIFGLLFGAAVYADTITVIEEVTTTETVTDFVEQEVTTTETITEMVEQQIITTETVIDIVDSPL